MNALKKKKRSPAPVSGKKAGKKAGPARTGLASGFGPKIVILGLSNQISLKVFDFLSGVSQ